jgi:arylsulfatase A
VPIISGANPMRFLIIAFSLLILPGSCVVADQRQPNIVLIMADDVGWEAFGCYGAEDYQTPHLDQLAAKGIRFAHCYSTPICTTSRVKIMTGQYNFRNYTHFGYLSPKKKHLDICFNKQVTKPRSLVSGN